MKNEHQKLEFINYIEKASIGIIAVLFIAFPIFFTNLTTDFFTLPKQVLLIFLSIALFILYGVKTILAEKVSIRRTPFDLPVLLFAVAIFLSTIFSVARLDSIANFIPALFAILSFFVITQSSKDEKNVLVLVASLLIGASLLALTSILSYYKVYVFPFDFSKIQNFTTAGSYMDQLFYLLFVFPLGLYFLSPFVIEKSHRATLLKKKGGILKLVGFGLASIIILAGIFISIYIVVKQNLYVVLPADAAVQIAFAAISQDSQRIFQGLLFGTGFGEFFIAFTKFKLASFNNTPYWSVAFFHSWSFVLELLATTGIVGLLSFLFLCFKVIKERPLFIPLLIALGLSFVIPLSFYTLTAIFFLLGIYAAIRGQQTDHKYFDVELQIVALKKGFIAFAPEETARKQATRTLSYIAFGIVVLFSLTFGYLTYDYINANTIFQKSLVAASQNNGQQTYTFQNAVLQQTLSGKYVDSYYRVFSQTNLALANALASSIPQGQQPDQQTTQTIYTLVQQSINSARQATTVSPTNTLNWQNLSSVYRALIGFGQSADQFAVQAQQEATRLDPTSPGEYITLGGIFYQLQSWDNAQIQFQQAINLKPDLPNSYYNLGHVLESKGDLQGALTQYEAVRQLVSNDPTNLDKINQEIQALQTKLGQQQTQPQAQQTSENPLTIPTPSVALPTQNPPVRIPGPSEAPTPTPTQGATEGGLPTPNL